MSHAAKVAKTLIGLIGRPNVGKSTLYNRLSSAGSPRPRALVHPTPGVTRDVLPATARLPGLPPFTLLDSPGVEESNTDSVARWGQVPDILLFMLDGAAGVTPEDQELAKKLRRAPSRVGRLGNAQVLIPVVNKCDLSAADAAVIESYALGLGEAVQISAADGSGLLDLSNALLRHMAPVSHATMRGEQEYSQLEPDNKLDELASDTDQVVAEEELANAEQKSQRRPISFAIVGRPNVGKSTLANVLAGRPISLTSEEAGTTRDVVIAEAKDRSADEQAESAIVLLDTAGLRRRARVQSSRGVLSDLERMSASAAVGALRRATVCGLVVDAKCTVTLQDAKIATLSVSEGKPVVVIVNKWDKIPRDESVSVRNNIQTRIDHLLSPIAPVPLIYLSALSKTETRPYRLLFSTIRSLARRTRARHASTRRLTLFLKDFCVQVPPPGVPRPTFALMTQTHSSPPSFILFGTWGAPSEAWERALRRALSRALDLAGVPIRFSYRGSTRALNRRRSGRR